MRCFVHIAAVHTALRKNIHKNFQFQFRRNLISSSRKNMCMRCAHNKRGVWGGRMNDVFHMSNTYMAISCRIFICDISKISNALSYVSYHKMCMNRAKQKGGYSNGYVWISGSCTADIRSFYENFLLKTTKLYRVWILFYEKENSLLVPALVYWHTLLAKQTFPLLQYTSDLYSFLVYNLLDITFAFYKP